MATGLPLYGGNLRAHLKVAEQAALWPRGLGGGGEGGLFIILNKAPARPAVAPLRDGLQASPPKTFSKPSFSPSPETTPVGAGLDEASQL